jgi:hypothetical protein
MRRARFYLLSLTWGLPLTLCGLTLAAVLRGLGYRSVDYYGARLYTLGHGWGGLSLGPILITCSDASDRLRRHELGHAVQNCRYGPFILPPVLLSILRYHLRNRRIQYGLPLTPYDSWWFEGEATGLGTAAVSASGRGRDCR